MPTILPRHVGAVVAAAGGEFEFFYATIALISGIPAIFASEWLLDGLLTDMNIKTEPKVLEYKMNLHLHGKPHLNRCERLWIVMFLIVSVMTLSPAVATALGIGDFTFSHLGSAEGLNSQRIYSLKQTDDGGVWMTTQRFVARYNGVGIESFELGGNGGRLNPVERNLRFVQSSDSVPQVFDSWGNIYRYNPVQNRFDVVADGASLFKNDNKLNDVYKEGDTYWLATGKGVFTLRDGKAAQVASGMYVNCIIPGPEGIMLFGTRQGLKSVSCKGSAASGIKLKPYLPHVVVSGHYDADTRRMWLGTYDKGLIIADGSGASAAVEGVPHNPVRNIVAYDSKTMLVGVEGGALPNVL